MKNIAKAINKWDPIGLFPFAPKDEYMNEIRRIYVFLHANKKTSVYELATTINKIFLDAFGNDVYSEDLERCMMIATEILDCDYRR